METELRTVADRVRHLRKERKMNQEDFAEYCGISRNTVSNIETEKTQISPENMDKIATKCGVTLDYILYGDRFSLPEQEGMLDADKEFMSLYFSLVPEERNKMLLMIKTFYPNLTKQLV